MKAGFDRELRSLERAYRADPTDRAIAQRYLRALHRGGDPDEAVRVRFRLGERVQACADVEIRWEADDTLRALAALSLTWKGHSLSAEDVRGLVAEDLALFDPVALANAWPRRKDGQIKLNTTLFLRRYPAH